MATTTRWPHRGRCKIIRAIEERNEDETTGEIKRQMTTMPLSLKNRWDKVRHHGKPSGSRCQSTTVSTKACGSGGKYLRCYIGTTSSKNQQEDLVQEQTLVPVQRLTTSRWQASTPSKWSVTSHYRKHGWCDFPLGALSIQCSIVRVCSLF